LNVCENRALRKEFVPKREEGIGGWGNLHNERLHNLHFSPSIVRVFLRGKWGTQIHAGFWWGNMKERNHLENLYVSSMIII